MLRTCQAATASARPPPLQVLRPVASWPGNTDTIFSLAYDAPRNRIITGAKDSQVRSQTRTKAGPVAVRQRRAVAALRVESRDCTLHRRDPALSGAQRRTAVCPVKPIALQPTASP